MNLADELLGFARLRPSGISPRRVEILGPLTAEPPDVPRETPAGGRQQNSVLVAAMCEELGSGITSHVVSRLLGLPLRPVSNYLCVLEQRGKLVTERVIKHGPGRPSKVYRWQGTRCSK